MNGNYDWENTVFKLNGISERTYHDALVPPVGTYHSELTGSYARLTSASTGEDGKGKNMPPYLAVTAWKRIE